MKKSEHFAANKKEIERIRKVQEKYKKELLQKEKEETKTKEKLEKQHRKGGSLKAPKSKTMSTFPTFSKET